MWKENIRVETYLNEYQFVKAKKFIENLPESYSNKLKPSLNLRVAFNSFPLSSKTVNDLLLESNSNKIQNTSTIETNYINRRRANPSSKVFARNIPRNVNTIEKTQKKNLGKRNKVKVEILSTNKFDIRADSVEQSVDKLKSNKLQTDNISYKKDGNNIRRKIMK